MTANPSRLERLFAPFERLIDPFVPPPEPAPPRALRPFLRWALSGARPGLWGLGASSLAMGAMEAGVFWLIGAAIDAAERLGREAFFERGWIWIALLIVLVGIAKPLIQVTQSALTSLVNGPAIAPMTIWRLHRHTLGQSMRFFEEDFTGRVAQKQMQTANGVGSLVIDALSMLGILTAFVGVMLAVLGAQDWRLALAGLGWVAGFAAILRWALPRVRAASRARAEARSALSGQLVDSLTHIRTVKLFAHGGREEEAAHRAVTRFREASLVFGRRVAAMRMMIALLNALATLAILLGVLALWRAGGTSIGAVAAAAMLALRLSNMSSWMSMSAMNIFSELGVIEDGAATLSPPHEIRDRPAAAAPRDPRGDIRFEDVTWRYGRETGGVAELGFHVAPGEKVGLVGPSGAGKTTTLALLLRLYEPSRGRILLDGADIAGLTQDGLRGCIAAVTQEAEIFNRAARANILYGRPEASEAEMIDAATRAQAHDFIAELRDSQGRSGYDAILGERGVKLSGGQRQRVALARAILKNAPVLALDEATSALDSETEAAIQQALRAAMDGRTVLAIAHRLSTVAAMDRVLVMDQGRVVEQGDHAALLAQGGLYARLWARQSGGFLGKG